MIRYPNLIPECNVDTAFVEMLGYIDPNHAPNISQVSSILEAKRNAKQKAIGFIDNDKKKPQYILQFKVLDGVIKNVKLLKHPDKEQYLVVVNPAMDQFVFTLCKDLDINITNYKFPNNLKAFIGFTKKESIKNNTNFKNLLNAIKQKNPPAISKIKHWIAKYHG
jgi:hypothetical protein